jgi:hypothetical protein
VTPERIAELRALWQMATRCPWIVTGSAAREIRGPFGHRVTITEYASDAAFIAAASTALPEALDEIERLRGEAAHHAEAMRNGGVSLAWAEEQKRITAGLEAQLQQAQEVCRVQAAEIAKLRDAARLNHIPCDDTGCSSDLCGAFR